MNTGVLSHKLIKHTHCGGFIMCQIYYGLIIKSCKKSPITTVNHFWSTVWAEHSKRVGSISTTVGTEEFGGLVGVHPLGLTILAGGGIPHPP